MNAHPATPSADPAPNDPCEDRQEACPHCALGHRVEQRLAMLQELAELGMTAARVAKQRIVDQAERERGTPPDPTGASDRIAKSFQLDFARAATAVRQTLALQEKIEQDFRARTDRQEAEAAARRAEAAQRRAAERQARAERRRNQVQAELTRVIRAKATPREAPSLLGSLNAWLRPERLDSDFGDAPLHEIFLRICRTLGVPESWSRQWGEDSETEDSGPTDAVAPIHVAEPAKTAEPGETTGPKKAEPPTRRQQNAPPPPWAVPKSRPSASAATALALCLAVPGTGPPG
jgi:hypothetical protein